MPEFAYVARDATGRKVEGVIEAATRAEATAVLAGRGLFPVSVDGQLQRPEKIRFGRVPRQHLATVYRQLADLLRNGVPLLRALDVIRRQTSHRVIRDVLGEVYRRVEDGASLGDAMARFEPVFGEMAVSMVRAGGEGGFLEESLARVAEFTAIQEDLRKRTLGAMAYPILLAIMGTLVTVALMVFFVPWFEPLFESLRQRNELPWITEFLLSTSTQLKRWSPLLLVGLVGTVWGLRAWARTDAGRWWVDGFKLRLPVAGNIFRNFAVARFCRVLGTLLRNGVPIVRALEISSTATGNRLFAVAIQKATQDITEGRQLAPPLAASGHFPPTVVEMIAVAEQANTLDSVLLDIADTLERDTWRLLELAVRLLEPVMLMVIASVVLVLVIALLYPMLRMSMAIG
ncbi:MAG: type II secretion system F family protein [Thermoguttaceae bacterium]|nr:type II secretion system F family protein [Thermoguttaceae bacterium]MDW8078291.1 type II secretion system F family protein [Thermoguttaceae bacterium]